MSFAVSIDKTSAPCDKPNSDNEEPLHWAEGWTGREGAGVIHILNFEPQLATTLPVTFELLKSAHLVIHPSVSGIVLHGSRGLGGGYRPTSDIDLSLIVDPLPESAHADLESFLHQVLATTFRQWQADIEPDLAVIFDTRSCGLRCFYQTAWHERLCEVGGMDCFGLYKTQKGYNGLCTQAGVQVKRMFPCLTIWQRN